MSPSGRIVILKPTPFDFGWLVGVRHWWTSRRTSYRISDESISLHSGDRVVIVPLPDIVNASSEGADVLLTTAVTVHRMRFIRDAGWVATSILEAAKSVRTASQDPADAATPIGPSTSDRLNDLVGLWQQGLLSDEEYESERRHFS